MGGRLQCVGNADQLGLITIPHRGESIPAPCGATRFSPLRGDKILAPMGLANPRPPPQVATQVTVSLMQSQTDQFAMIPDAGDLNAIDRQIGFVESIADDPKRLSPRDIERFNRDGYLGPLDAFDSPTAQSTRAYFDELLNRTQAAGGDAYSISSAHLQYGPVWDLLNHPAIVDYVVDLLGPDVVGWGAHFFCKLPHDDRCVDWHQDCIFWPLTPTRSVTVWLAIDDADEHNGCMEVLLGSHRHGMIDYEASGDGDANVLNQTIRDPHQWGTHHQTPIRAGQISIHSDLLVHGSPANPSDRRRCGLTLRYCPADVEAYLGWNRKGVVVRGRADAVKWPNRSRPDADLPGAGHGS